MGETSAGWLKSGMAFRMIDGMQIREEIAREPQRSINMSETSYMGRRIFWSAYTWDK
jgi:hypothetical protein